MTAVVRCSCSQMKNNDRVSNALIVLDGQPSKYTLSRKQRCTPDGVPGIGWSDEGIEK